MYDSFLIYSSDHIRHVADSYLAQLEIANNPTHYKPSSTILAGSSRNCVEAAPGRLAYNFHSKAIQGLIGSDIPRVEALVSEAWRRLSNMPEQMEVLSPSVFVRLEREAERFLDNKRGYGALDAEDVMVLSLASGRELALYNS